MTTAVTVDVAGGPMGGAARFRDELYRYLWLTERKNVAVIGAERRLAASWLIKRELTRRTGRRVALNNVSFFTGGGDRWTLLGNALHFLTEAELLDLHPSLRTVATRQATIVRLAAKRSDVLIAPCSAMADRVARILPSAKNRLAIRMHPVSGNFVRDEACEPLILCPVLFEEYKHMPQRIAEWVGAIDKHLDPAVRMLVTASPGEVPPMLAANQRVQLVGRLTHTDLCNLWVRSRAVYFPTGLESFGYPLAEARVNGQPVIARDTEQNREIAGSALCAFDMKDPESLLTATECALRKQITPEPGPFNPTAYFDWMLGYAGR